MTTFEIKTIQYLKGIDMAEHHLPVMILDSGKEGPVLWLLAASHGDEVNGIEVIHRIFKFLKRAKLKKGKIYALPIANPRGFELRKRENPFDLEDMNRNFPGNPKGTTTERINYAIFKFIIDTEPTILIDLHADYINSIPYIITDMIKNTNAQEAGAKTRDFVDKFGLTVVEDFEADQSLTYALVNEAKIPAFVVELGGPNIISENFVRTGTNGIKNILKHLDLIDYPNYWKSETRIKNQNKLKLMEYVTCDESGVVKFLVKPGQKVKKNKPLAKIRDILGKTKGMVTAPTDCYVISCADTAVAFPGSFLFLLAAEEKKEITKKKIPKPEIKKKGSQEKNSQNT